MSTFIKTRLPSQLVLLLILGCGVSFLGLSKAHGQNEQTNGIQPLLELKKASIHSLIPTGIRPLIFPNEIEQFLQKLEGLPPNWSRLRHTDITEQSERLFHFNRQRDSVRMAEITSLEQPVAFIWSGLLRHYIPDSEGFLVALGPEFTNTSWGIIRFKAIDLPDDLVAIPSVDLRHQFLAHQKNGRNIEIVVVCIGTLIPDESLIYGFSHDGHQEGMILPVVSVQSLIYVFKAD